MQDLPFITGIEIRTSNNPAHKEDICDMLAGIYPKEFKWTGWHPNCMCYEVPLLSTKDEIDEMVDAVLDGRDPDEVECENVVTDVPDGFKKWISQNESRMKQAISMPYFIRDNTAYVSSVLDDIGFAKELIEKYGIIIPKHIPNNLYGILLSDVTGGIATKASQGITALINSYYEAHANRERVEILQKIIANKGFEKLTYHSTKDNSIYGIGMEMFDRKLKKGEMPANLSIAKKMLQNGYDVYLLPNPNSSVGADFILHKKGKLYYTEGKTLNGSNSLDHRLLSAAKQSDRIIIDIIGTNNSRYIAKEVKYAFERNNKISEVILLKGNRVISIKRDDVNGKLFEKIFNRIWNMGK